MVTSAEQIGQFCKARLLQLLEGVETLENYERKRRIPKLRLYSGRLLYVGNQDDLAYFGERMSAIPELMLRGKVLTAVSDKDVSSLIGLGTNAVQSVAQVLRLSPEAVRCRPSTWGLAECQGLAVLRLNGVQLDFGRNGDLPNDELNRLAKWDETAPALMRSADPFIREIACLHGVDQACRYDSLLDSAFDIDEQLAFDAISQLNESTSGFGF